MRVSVILPARNETGVIRKMVTMMLALYSKYILEIIVVDDGSTDDTAKIVKSIAKHDHRVKLISRASPHGVGLAIRTGLKHVSKQATHIFSLDSDFIRNLPDLEDFFIRIKDYDGLIGSRYLRQHSLIRYPATKKFFNRCFHLLVRLLYGVSNADLTNNFKLYKKSVFDRLSLSADGYAVNAETGLYPILLGFHIGEIPVTWYARDDDMGFSKFNLLKVASGYIGILVNASRYSNRFMAKYFFKYLRTSVEFPKR